MSAIEEFAKQIGEKFGPDKIILFGSHAYGTPHDDSDVDLLVIYSDDKMPKERPLVRSALKPEFACDILFRTTSQIKERLRLRDFFIEEILQKGRVLYAA